MRTVLENIQREYHANNVSVTLKTLIFPGFENFKVALRILATLPMTSYEYE